MFKLNNKKFSPTGKRFDMTVKVIPFIGEDYQFRLRILAYEPIPEKKIEEIVEQVIERKKEWCGKNKPEEVSTFLSLNGFNGNAFVNPKS